MSTLVRPSRPMARISPPTAHPAADAAALLRRLGFALLMLAVPVTALFARRAVVVLAPLGIILLVIAAALDGGARPLRGGIRKLALAPAGQAGALVLFWCSLSLIWTPFPSEASERFFNILGIVAAAAAGYLALPDRMRSANLYILPVGVAAAALAAMLLTLFGAGTGADVEQEGQNLERGLIVLVLLLWPAVAWLRSRGRHLESLLLVAVVSLATIFAPQPMPLQGLAAGAVIFAITAVDARFGARLAAVAIAGLLLLAPLLPFLLKPLAVALLRADAPVVESLEVWRSVVMSEPVRLITGHGFETALRARFAGLLSPQAPQTLLFEIWYDLGLVAVVAGATALYLAARLAGRNHPLLVPGMMAAFASAFAFACLGIGVAHVWWLTALAVMMLMFVAAERGQFRTDRPKAILRRRT